MRASSIWLLIAGALSWGCSDAGGTGTRTFSPQPQPSPEKAVNWAIDSIRLEADGADTRIIGAPGAVHPGTMELRVLNLDQPTLWWTGQVLDDGSFEARVAGELANVYRLYASQLLPYGGHLDVTAASSGAAVEVVELTCGALADSQLSIDGVVGMEASAMLQLHNDCAETLSISSQATLAQASPLSFEPLALPISLASGEGTSVSVQFVPEEEGAAFDILQLGVAEANRGRVSITLIGLGSAP